MPGGFPAEINIPADTWMTVGVSLEKRREGMFWIKPMHRLRGKRQEAVLSVTVSQGDAHRRLPVPC